MSATEPERFLAERLRNPSSEWVGLSSDAMIAAAIDGRAPDEWDYPRDTADLSRCCVTFARAPRDLRLAMLPILADYCEFVAARSLAPVSGGAEGAA